jgi:hypothetical protein
MPRPRLYRLIPGFLAIVSAGCGGPPRPTNTGPAVPPEATARAGLVEALSAWREGRPATSGASPQVGLVDSERIANRRLRSFEVLGPIELGVGRGFTVRLGLEPLDDGDESEEQVTRYVVFGIDPLWVFRLEDYERISHWEHKMDPETDDPGT